MTVREPADVADPRLRRCDLARDRWAREVFEASAEPGVLVVQRSPLWRDRDRPADPGRLHDRHPGLFLGHVTGDGCRFVDRELCLPRSLFATPALRETAGVTAAMSPLTPAELVVRMLNRAKDSGSRAEWLVTGTGFAGHWPLLALLRLRRMSGLLQLDRAQAETWVDHSHPPLAGALGDGSLWVLSQGRRPGDPHPFRLLLRRRVDDPADRDAYLVQTDGPADLDLVLSLVRARSRCLESFGEVRRAAREERAAAVGAPAPTDPYATWYRVVTSAMTRAGADPGDPCAQRSG